MGLTTEQLLARHAGLGATDGSAILGVNPWKSALALYMEKTSEPVVKEPNERMMWGNRLERVVADAWAEETKNTIVPVTETFYHPQHRELLANLDFLVVGRDGHEDLEIKTAPAAALGDWEDGIPLMYQVQVQHQLMCAGLDKGYIACLFGGQAMRWQEIGRDERFIKSYKDKCLRFWEDHVIKRIPPPVDPERDGALLSLLFPREEAGKVVTLPGELVDTDERLAVVKEELGKLGKEKEVLENQIKAALGDAERGVLPSGVSYTWKAWEKKGYTIPSTQGRSLRRKETKGCAS